VTAGPQHADALRRAYGLMRGRFGHQHWWPGDTPFEVCIGAILTQNTSWSNVERAIANLKAAGVLEPGALFGLPEGRLAGLLRPAGYFNVKARRLRAFLDVLVGQFDRDLSRLLGGSVEEARGRLLAIRGVGPETADSMLLYAGAQERFVVDAYTRRIFARHGWSPPEAGYDELQWLCETALDHRPAAHRLDYWQDYHAQLVRVGKDFCRPRNPRCDSCPLEPLLPDLSDAATPGATASTARNTAGMRDEPAMPPTVSPAPERARLRPRSPPTVPAPRSGAQRP